MSNLLTPPTKEELEQEKFERKEKRLQDCGAWASWIDPHTGRITGFTFHCDLWRECPRCLARRAMRERKFLEETIQNKSIVALELSEEEIRKITRKLDKDEYQRFPQENHDLIFMGRNTAIALGIYGDSIEVTARVINEMNWEKIVDTPGRKNKSGALFTSTKPTSKEENWAIVEITQFVSNAPREIVNATGNAIANQMEMQPQTIEEVVEGIQTRVYAVISSLEARGYSCTTYRKKVKVSMGKVDWCQNLCLINDKNDNGKYQQVTRY